MKVTTTPRYLLISSKKYSWEISPWWIDTAKVGSKGSIADFAIIYEPRNKILTFPYFAKRNQNGKCS